MNTFDPDRVAAQLRRMREVFTQRPAAALVDGAPALAEMRDGMVCEVLGPGGEQMRCDLSPAAGGDGTAPGPGWFMRAAMGACTAMLLRQRAAELGLSVDSIVVRVEGRLDLRGAFGWDGVDPAMQDLRLTVELRTAPSERARAEAVARWAVERSPVVATVRHGVPCAVEVHHV